VPDRSGPAGLLGARRTAANFMENASRLYEQERWAPSGASLLEMYARRWFTWITGGPRKVHQISCDAEPNRCVSRQPAAILGSPHPKHP
jgi:hypothetical protein